MPEPITVGIMVASALGWVARTLVKSHGGSEETAELVGALAAGITKPLYHKLMAEITSRGISAEADAVVREPTSKSRRDALAKKIDDMDDTELLRDMAKQLAATLWRAKLVEPSSIVRESFTITIYRINDVLDVMMLDFAWGVLWPRIKLGEKKIKKCYFPTGTNVVEFDAGSEIPSKFKLRFNCSHVLRRISKIQLSCEGTIILES